MREVTGEVRYTQEDCIVEPGSECPLNRKTCWHSTDKTFGPPYYKKVLSMCHHYEKITQKYMSNISGKHKTYCTIYCTYANSLRFVKE